MEQYLDQKDGKWHITFSTNLPKVIIKNKLNFRLYSVNMINGEAIRDPVLKNSSYIFSIPESLNGRSVFFNTSFDINQISNIEEFCFSLCDEKVSWSKEKVFIKNEYSNKVINVDNIEAEDLEAKIFIDEASLLFIDNIKKNKDIVKEKEEAIINISNDLSENTATKADNSLVTVSQNTTFKNKTGRKKR
jgi:hypothetical protein